VEKTDNKIRFIDMKLEDKIRFEGLKKLEIVKLLESYNFDKIHNEDYSSSPFSSLTSSLSEEEGELESENTKLNNSIRGYDYLMKMTCWTFSSEEVII